ncbi:hypothetical protein MKX01_001494 [Papaver californicum]|nr:hypothetical protein MKX01_001494 [Papaver californicum]
MVIIEEMEFIMNNKEMEEIEFITNNEELEKLEEMEFIMNNEELEEMKFSMNNEEMKEMNSNPCFPETITDSLLQTTLEEITTHAGESSVATRSSKELPNEQRLTIPFLIEGDQQGKTAKGLGL